MDLAQSLKSLGIWFCLFYRSGVEQGTSFQPRKGKGVQIEQATEYKSLGMLDKLQKGVPIKVRGKTSEKHLSV